MIEIMFILVYLASFSIHLLVCYRENKRHIHNVGELLDEIEFYMWFPLLNTITLIVVAVILCIVKIWKISKLDILWEKFRNIKLK